MDWVHKERILESSPSLCDFPFSLAFPEGFSIFLSFLVCCCFLVSCNAITDIPKQYISMTVTIGAFIERTCSMADDFTDAELGELEASVQRLGTTIRQCNDRMDAQLDHFEASLCILAQKIVQLSQKFEGSSSFFGTSSSTLASSTFSLTPAFGTLYSAPTFGVPSSAPAVDTLSTPSSTTGVSTSLFSSQQLQSQPQQTLMFQQTTPNAKDDNVSINPSIKKSGDVTLAALACGTDARDKIMTKVDEMDELRLSNGMGFSAGEWVDSLTNISVGDLLSGASEDLEDKSINPTGAENCNGLLEIPFSADSFDAAIAAHISRHHEKMGHQPTLASHTSSIWDAEETCDAFLFKRDPISHEDGPCLSPIISTESNKQVLGRNSDCSENLVQQLAPTGFGPQTSVAAPPPSLVHNATLTTQMAKVAPVPFSLTDCHIQAIVDAYKEEPGNSKYAFKQLFFCVAQPEYAFINGIEIMPMLPYISGINEIHMRLVFEPGVSGGTISGKTMVCDMIFQHVVLVNQNSFYRGLTLEELKRAHEYNFDHPDAFDTEQLLECMEGLSVLKALLHASVACKCKLFVDWISATDLEDLEAHNSAWRFLKGANRVPIPGVFGDRGMQGKICAVKYARENNVPVLGTCLGMQIAVIEFARYVLGLHNANSTEFDSETKTPCFLFMLEGSKTHMGGTMRLGLRRPYFQVADCKSTKMYNNASFIDQRCRHRYEVNPDMISWLRNAGLFLWMKMRGAWRSLNFLVIFFSLEFSCKSIPLGVVLTILPFNYPVNLAFSKIAPALIAGKSLVLKPLTQGVVPCLHMVQCFHLAAFPKGLISGVTGKGSEIGDFLTMHPGVNCISFTGGDTSISIPKKAGMIPLQMELGGKDACIVLEDADLDLVASNIVQGGFSYNGQRCTALKVVLVMESVVEVLVEKVKAKVAKLTVGPPENNCDITLVVTESSANYIKGLVKDVKEKRATFCQESGVEMLFLGKVVLDMQAHSFDLEDKVNIQGEGNVTNGLNKNMDWVHKERILESSPSLCDFPFSLAFPEGFSIFLSFLVCCCFLVSCNAI